MSTPLRVLLHNAKTADFEQQLSDEFPEIQVAGCNSYSELPDKLRDFRPDVVYAVRFDGSSDYPRDALLGPDGPKWLANGGVGIDHLFPWDMQSTTVTNGAGVAADMMAEYIIGGFLHFSLNVPGFQQDQNDRYWRIRTVSSLRGKTLLIAGLGSAGQATARLAKAFGMTVIGTRNTPQDMDNVDEVFAPEDLINLMPRADFIAVCAPLTAKTRGMIGRECFAAMQSHVIIADVSRGGVIDSAALTEALQNRRIGGAALDVFEVEPLPFDNPLWGFENVLISPHCSSVYAEWEQDSFDLFKLNLRNYLDGKPLKNIVDPNRGY